MVETLLQWLVAIPIWQLYVVFFAIAYLENIVPPIPGDVLLAFAGYLVAIDSINMVYIWGGSTIFSVVGFMNVYQVGTLWNDIDKSKLPWSIIARLYSKKLEHRVRRAMRKWGYGIIVINRFLAGTRTVVSLIAGMSGMNKWKVLGLSALSSASWNALLLFLGYTIGENWAVVGTYLTIYAKWLLILVAFVIAGRYFKSLYKKK